MKPLLVAGPSGSGKGTLIKRILKDFPDAFRLSASHTTREPWAEDINGVTYNFVQKEQFLNEIKNDEFYEYTWYNNNLYGTNKQTVKKIVSEGKICILELELNGAKNMHESDLECNYIYLLIPNLDTLIDRLKKRGSEKEESFQSWLNLGKEEIQKVILDDDYSFFEHKFINDDFEEMYLRVRALLLKLYPSLSTK